MGCVAQVKERSYLKKGLQGLRVLLCIYLVFGSQILAWCGDLDPLVVGVLMVKNESPVIVETLQPLVEGGVDAFYIFDTGSTDDTIEKTKQYFEKSGIKNYGIEQEPFVNFAVPRNRAIELTEKRFPQATFMLFLDAEWYVKNVKSLIEFCKKEKEGSAASYDLRLIHNGASEFTVQRLLRVNMGCHFEGAVHEYVVCLSSQKGPQDVLIECNNSKYGQDKTKARFHRDLPLLLKEFAGNPTNSRTVFYLGQTYECLGDYDNAYRFYELYTHLNGWDEELFEANFRLGRVIEYLVTRDVKKETLYNFPQASWYYFRAFSMRPHRIEPLVALAKRYMRTENYALAYLLLQRALDVPYPVGERLFVDKTMYQYERYDLMGKCALQVGQYEVGERALRKGLEINPNDEELMDVLRGYADKKAEDVNKRYENTADLFFKLYDTAVALESRSYEGPFMWNVAMEYYLYAYSADPRHAEPLIRIARHYMQANQQALAYLFIQPTLNMAVPANVRAIEQELYTSERYDIYGVSAWYVGDFDAGEKALRKALEVKPDDQRLLGNLKFYVERVKN